jgi:DNA-directed RNA polymerase subunit RPC12/RpoP
MLKKYCLYILRWQLSTPILYGVIWLLTGHINAIWITIIANFIGALIFFWVDKFIFRNRRSRNPLWEIKEGVNCHDCGVVSKGYRIVEWQGYSRIDDKEPEYRCKDCSAKKLLQVEKLLY